MVAPGVYLQLWPGKAGLGAFDQEVALELVTSPERLNVVLYAIYLECKFGISIFWTVHLLERLMKTQSPRCC